MSNLKIIQLYTEIKDRYNSLDNLAKRLQKDYDGELPFVQEEQDRLDLCSILDLIDEITKLEKEI